MGRKRKRWDSGRGGSNPRPEVRDTVHDWFQKKFTYRPPTGSWRLPDHMLDPAFIRSNQSRSPSTGSDINIIDDTSFKTEAHNQSVELSSADENEGIQSLRQSGSQSHTLLAVCGTASIQLYPSWQNTKLMKFKQELNELKSQLNDKDLLSWHHHTRAMNIASDINCDLRQWYYPELCTQAWSKFYEIVSSYPILDLDSPVLATIHLCEAPGAFVTSLNHFLFSHGYQGDWQWRATTLNPYYEGNALGAMIDDDRFIRCSHGNWWFGADGTGNLMSRENLMALQQMVKENGPVSLVTADGSVDCQGDPGEQEKVVSQLIYCEILTALRVLGTGGSFVLKTFTLYEDCSISMMFLLNCVFHQVEVFKPGTSKGGNSETYIVCLNYKGPESIPCLESLCQVFFSGREPAGCILSQEMVPSDFLLQHEACCQLYKELQSRTIRRNLELYDHQTEADSHTLQQLKDFCSEYFFSVYHLTPMVHQARIMKSPRSPRKPKRVADQQCPQDPYLARAKREGKFIGTFDERGIQSRLSWQQRVNQMEVHDDIQEEEVLWLQHDGKALDPEDVIGWSCVSGQRVQKVQSSRFCDNSLIKQTQELLQNVQWLHASSLTDSCVNLQTVVDSLYDVIGEKLTRNDEPGRHSQQEDELTDSGHQPGDGANLNEHSRSTMPPDVEMTGSPTLPDISALHNATQDGMCGESHHLQCFTNGEGHHGQCSSNGEGEGHQRQCSTNNSSCKLSQCLKYQCDCSDKHSASDTECPGRFVEGRPTLVDDLHVDSDLSGHEVQSLQLLCQTCSSAGCSCVHSDNAEVRDCGTDSVTMVTDRPSLSTHVKVTVKNTSSHIFSSLAKKFEASQLDKEKLSLEEDRLSEVVCYQATDCHVTCRLDEQDQPCLFQAVLDILQTCPPGGAVLLELGTCLTRVTAGLIYLLYRVFTSVGFCGPVAGSGLVHHLLCTGFLGPPPTLVQYLTSIQVVQQSAGSTDSGDLTGAGVDCTASEGEGGNPEAISRPAGLRCKPEVEAVNWELGSTSAAGNTSATAAEPGAGNPTGGSNPDEQSRVLELVPIQVLLSEFDFLEILRRANGRLLKTFINYTVTRERKLLL